MYVSHTPIKFDSGQHKYTLGSREIPSVTTIMRATRFKNKYAGIDQAVLENAARFGTAVHDAIEHDNPEGLSLQESLAYEQWLKLKIQHGIIPLSREQIVHYGILYAGMYDMIAEIDGELWLIDVKTTSELDKDYISHQLTMYEEASYEMGYESEFDKLGCIWIPRGRVGRLVEIDRVAVEAVQEMLDEFRKNPEGLEAYESQE